MEPRINRNIPGYSGSIENPTRIIGELIEDTKEALRDARTVAICVEVDAEAIQCEDPDGECRAIFELLRDDLNVTITDYS